MQNDYEPHEIEIDGRKLKGIRICIKPVEVSHTVKTELDPTINNEPFIRIEVGLMPTPIKGRIIINSLDDEPGVTEITEAFYNHIIKPVIFRHLEELQRELQVIEWRHFSEDEEQFTDYIVFTKANEENAHVE